MSRSSPGRYALQDFAKSVSDVHALDPDGRAVGQLDAIWNSMRVERGATS